LRLSSILQPSSHSLSNYREVRHYRHDASFDGSSRHHSKPLGQMSVTFLNSFFKERVENSLYSELPYVLKDNFEWIILGSDSVDISGVTSNL
jgi:phosphoserine phosphatase